MLLVELAVFSFFTGIAAVNQEFTSSAVIDIAACPITFYGLKYEKLYVGFDYNTSSVCFNGQYRPGQSSDCILMSRGSANRGALTVLNREIPTGSGLHKLLPSLNQPGRCLNIIPLKDEQDSEIKQIELGNFGSQAIVAIKTHAGFSDNSFETQTVVNGQSVVSQVFPTSKTSKGVVTDVSGCRLFGTVYKINTTVWDADICSTVTCDLFGEATAVSTCGPMERCQGNNICTLDATCTVTGPTIIDVVGKLHTVPDRCGYKLMGHASIPDLEVRGVFKERRRKDVSFLHRVVLHLNSFDADISLEQGGRVKVNGKAVAFASQTVVNGVKLSKGLTGITAEVTASEYTAYIYYDGNTAQIRIKGPNVAQVSGLCGDSSTTFAQEKEAGLSDSGCSTIYPEDDTDLVNCSEATQWCHVLNEPPFSACNLVVNPKPFLTACFTTLCKYPAVDGFSCQFLEAYSRACSAHNVTVDKWRPQVQCDNIQDSCLDKYCSDHEFCGKKRNGWETGCQCRGIFASKYRSANMFGEPTLCKDHKATLALAACLLEEKGIDYNALHMNDESCVGQMDNETHMVTFGFDNIKSCGTVVKSNNSEIIYQNTIKTRNSANFITRHDDMHIDFSCLYMQPDVKSLAISIKDSSVMQELVSGQWRYNLSMNAFTDAALTHAITPSTELRLDQRVFVELAIDGLDEKHLSLVIDSCWATPEPSVNSIQKYNLIENGCPNPKDKTIDVVRNGLGVSSFFYFNIFQFTGGAREAYLHCKTVLCVKQEDSCTLKCDHSSRSRRSIMSKYLEQNPALITMAWSH